MWLRREFHNFLKSFHLTFLDVLYYFPVVANSSPEEQDPFNRAQN